MCRTTDLTEEENVKITKKNKTAETGREDSELRNIHSKNKHGKQFK